MFFLFLAKIRSEVEMFFDNKTLTLSVSGNETFTDWTIEQTFPEGIIFTNVILNGTYTELMKFTFRDRINLTTVTITAPITKIGRQCFQNTSITEINLPETVTSLDLGTFQSCVFLKKFVSPPLMENIAENAFIKCTAMEEIVLTNVKTLESRAFAGCVNLKSLQLGSKIETIGQMAFLSARMLSSIEFPTSLTYINAVAFSNCNFSTLIFPETPLILGESSFSNNFNLKTVIFNGPIIIGYNTFKDCSLESVTFKNESIQVNDLAFPTLNYTIYCLSDSVGGNWLQNRDDITPYVSINYRSSLFAGKTPVVNLTFCPAPTRTPLPTLKPTKTPTPSATPKPTLIPAPTTPIMTPTATVQESSDGFDALTNETKIAIIGAAVAGGVIIIAIVIVCVLCNKRKTNSRLEIMQNDPYLSVED